VSTRRFWRASTARLPFVGAPVGLSRVLVGGTRFECSRDFWNEPSLCSSLRPLSVASLFIRLDNILTDHTLIEADMIDLVYLRQRAAVHSRMKKAPHLTMDKSRDRNEEWRRFGMARRQEIVEQDALVGGNHFEVNLSHPVERYFELADRVRTANYNWINVP
jgi:hypothetical protein